MNIKKNLTKIALVIGLVLVLTITAFAVFDLTGYNSNTVNNAMASYDHPSEIVSYMASHFTYKSHSTSWSPEQFYINKWGDCNDFATYGIYCAYKVAGMSKESLYQVRIRYTDGVQHVLAIYALYPTFPEFNFGYSSNGNYYHSKSFRNWFECVDNYLTYHTSKTAVWADCYSYDYNLMQRVTF